jgi:hypothetical protein
MLFEIDSHNTTKNASSLLYMLNWMCVTIKFELTYGEEITWAWENQHKSKDYNFGHKQNYYFQSFYLFHLHSCPEL